MSTRFLRVSPLIPARDVEEAIRFYHDVLGFELDYRDAEPAQFAIVGRDSAWLNLAGSTHPNGTLGTRPWGTREFSIIDPSGVCIAFVEENS